MWWFWLRWAWRAFLFSKFQIDWSLLFNNTSCTQLWWRSNIIVLYLLYYVFKLDNFIPIYSFLAIFAVLIPYFTWCYITNHAMFCHIPKTIVIWHIMSHGLWYHATKSSDMKNCQWYMISIWTNRIDSIYSLVNNLSYHFRKIRNRLLFGRSSKSPWTRSCSKSFYRHIHGEITHLFT